jgi:tetratricopeptide (TPR) repeat protein
MLEHALTLVAPDSTDAARLLANHAFLINLDGDHAAGNAELERALAIASRIGDDQLTAALLLQSTGQAATQLDIPRALEHGRAAVAVADRSPDIAVQAAAHATCGHIMAGCTAATEEARFHQAAAFARERHLSRGWRLELRYVAGGLALMTGEWAVAQKHVGDALELDPGCAFALGLAAQIAATLGEQPQAESMLKRLGELESAPGPLGTHASGRLAAAAAYCDLLTGTDNHGAHILAAATRALAAHATPLNALVARAGLALHAVNAGDDAAAADHIGQFVRLRDLRVLPGPILTTDRLLGFLHATAGRRATAEEHFAAARRHDTAAGFHTDAAWATFEHAQTLAATDTARASKLTTEAEQLAHRHGIRSLLDRIAQTQALTAG